MGLSGEVAIIGTGAVKFGENFTQSYFDMVEEASRAALADAGIGPDRIEAGWLGTCYAYDYTTEGNAGTSLAEPLGLYGIPISRVANYCATGMDAVRNAALAIAAGEYDVVLVVGAEKMRDVEPRGSLVAQHVERGHPVYCKGRTAPGQFALLANRYFSAYGNAKEEMAMVAVKNHANGALNPRAHFRKAITVDQVLNAPDVASPLGLLDCCPTTDGAAAVVLARTSVAKGITDRYAVIRGISLAVTSGYFNAQFDPNWGFTGFASTQKAAAAAYKQAGITNPRAEVDVAEVHDCFTITELLNYEDLGFCEKGGARRLVQEGVTQIGGDLPVNTSGGLKACGHPIGASGVRMVVDIVDQLWGRAGKRQVAAARTGLAHTLGGPGAVASVAVISA